MSYEFFENNVAEVGIKICDFSMNGKNIGGRALSLLIEYLFSQGVNKIILDTNEKNKRAQHVYETLEFRFVNKVNDAFCDQLGEKLSLINYDLIKEDFHTFILKK